MKDQYKVYEKNLKTGELFQIATMRFEANAEEFCLFRQAILDCKGYTTYTYLFTTPSGATFDVKRILTIRGLKSSEQFIKVTLPTSELNKGAIKT